MSELLFSSDGEARDFAGRLATRAIGKRIDFRARAGSTNDLAQEAARNGAAHGKVFIAEAQERGRGRRGRSWESPAGLGLLFSVLVRPGDVASQEACATELGWVPLAAGMACAEAIAGVTGLKLVTKWPNDIVIPCLTPPGWRKLGGILCESVLAGAGGTPAPQSQFIVIGIGLNINHDRGDLLAHAKAPPTSVRLETGKLADRRQILAAVLEELERRLTELAGAENEAALEGNPPVALRRIEDGLRRWWTPERTLLIETPDGRMIRGSFGGLDEFGRLRIRDSCGQEEALADAEVLSAL